VLEVLLVPLIKNDVFISSKVTFFFKQACHTPAASRQPRKLKCSRRIRNLKVKDGCYLIKKKKSLIIRVKGGVAHTVVLITPYRF